MPPGRVPFAPTGYAVDGFAADPDVLPYFGFEVYLVPTPVVHTYILPDKPMAASVLIAVNGNVLQQDVDYTVSADDSQFTVSAALHSGDSIIARWCAAEHLVY